MSRRLTIEQVKEICDQIEKEREIRCLNSEEYINTRKNNLKWLCLKDKYEWKTSFSNIKQGKGCPKCAKVQKVTIEECYGVAKEKKGKCLSKKYINAHTKMNWECNLGHTWLASFNNIKRGQWCPICNSGISERICKSVFEQLFNIEFKKIKPDWLRNKKGNKLELDGYNEELKIAFEHQGKQHDTYIEYFHKSKEKFKRSQESDKLKIQKCKEKGIFLVVIPSLNYYLEKENLKNFIIEELKKQNFEYDYEKLEKIEINFSKVELDNNSDMIKKIKKLEQEKNIVFLSDKYINSISKYKWKCLCCDHIWEATYYSVKIRKACPSCSNYKRYSLEDCFLISNNKNFIFLSNKFFTVRDKYKWKCKSCNYIWNSNFDNFRRSTGCPKCKKKIINCK